MRPASEVLGKVPGCWSRGHLRDPRALLRSPYPTPKGQLVTTVNVYLIMSFDDNMLPWVEIDGLRKFLEMVDASGLAKPGRKVFIDRGQRRLFVEEVATETSVMVK
jgi:hypothetical protein